MSRSRAALGALAMLAMLAGPVAAQDHAVYLFARGGGVNDLTDLNTTGSLDLNKTGYSLGAGVAVQVQKYIVLRADYTYARSTLQQNSVDTNQDVARNFYDAALQLQYPFADGLEPYVFAGGGGVTIQQVDASASDVTKGTFTYGLGLNYQPPSTQWQFFVEGKSWVYEPTDVGGALIGLDKWQNDLAWTFGVGYRLPF